MHQASDSCCSCLLYLQKEKGEGKRRELQSHLTRLQQMMTEEKTRRKAKELEQGWKVGRLGLNSDGRWWQFVCCCWWNWE